MKTQSNATLGPLRDGFYLTDGGLETTLIFHENLDLPHFAAFGLLEDGEGRRILSAYYKRYQQIAEKHGLNFVLESPTWRANTDWAYKLGYSLEEISRVNRDAIAFMKELRISSDAKDTHVVVSGNIGPRGDGYAPDRAMNAEDAKAYHEPQVRAFKEAGADVVSALTLNYVAEALGVVEAARAHDIPIVISFTVETDGRLPDGETLRVAIERTDQETDGYVSYYMINCAHPEHFLDVLDVSGEWKNRIGGVRANASTKSHAELDESVTLDSGDPEYLADGYKELIRLLPNLQVIGGCCGTDHTHMEAVCQGALAGYTG